MFSLTVIVVGAGGCGGQWVLGKHGDWIGAGGGGVGGSAIGGSENKTGASGTNGGYMVVGRGGQGWDINGTTYGDGGDSTAISSNGEGKNGCVYIRYEF